MIKPLVIDSCFLNEPLWLCSAAFRYGLILLNNWHGSDYEFVRLGSLIGELERPYLNDPTYNGHLFRVRRMPRQSDAVGDYWHADGFAHTNEPAILTIYHVATGATSDACTSFLDGFVAWDLLPNHLRNELLHIKWVHSSGSSHPFARTHEYHQKTALSLNLGKIIKIEDYCANRMESLIDEIRTFLNGLHKYCHHWDKGQVLFVDNRRLLHHAPEHTLVPRELWRISIVRLN